MRKLCIIIDAGASKDVAGKKSASTSRIGRGWEPPLTTELFEQRSTFEDVLKHFIPVNPLIVRLRNLVATSPESLESLLSKIASSHNPIETVQLKYLAYYLRCLLHNVSKNYIEDSPSNYDALMDAILRRDIEVLLLTLNYDLFLEATLQSAESHQFNKLKDYIPSEKRWKLIKLHGSVNWGRRLLNSQREVASGRLKEVDELQIDTGLYPEIFLHDDVSPYPIFDRSLLYPVLAIPIDTKYEYICPPEHISEAQSFLNDCTNFLVLGCSLKDQTIRDLLGQNVQNVDRIRIVNGANSRKEEAELIERLSRIQHFNRAWTEPPIYIGGFDQFVMSRELETFLDNLP